MSGRMWAPAIVLAIMLAAVPLPSAEEGKTLVGPGESWIYRMDLASPARVTYIVESSSALDVQLLDQRSASDGSPRNETIRSHDQVTKAHRTEQLSPGAYQLVVRNAAAEEAEMEYQVHLDYEVVGELTAKNLMALFLTMAVVIVALFLFRPRRGGKREP